MTNTVWRSGVALRGLRCGSSDSRPSASARQSAVQWTVLAAWLTAGAHGGAQIHEGLGVGRQIVVRCVGLGNRPQAPGYPARAGPTVDGVVSAQHAFHVAVQNGVPVPEAERQNGGGSGSSDARQGHQPVQASRQFTVVVADHRLGGAV